MCFRYILEQSGFYTCQIDQFVLLLIASLDTVFFAIPLRDETKQQRLHVSICTIMQLLMTFVSGCAITLKLIHYIITIRDFLSSCWLKADVCRISI